jgi:hypothetical protein
VDYCFSTVNFHNEITYKKERTVGVFKRLAILAGAAAFSNLALTAVNILQAGPRKPDGRTMGEILGKDPAQAFVEDVKRLSRSETMQLFYAAETPDFRSMQGEYQAEVLKGGVLGPASIYFTHHIFPTGNITLDTHWEGKAFLPAEKTSGYGYNLFSAGPTSGQRQVLRTRKFRTWIGPTTIGKDEKDSFHLDYSTFNTGLIHSMHDEVRQINEHLFICAGYMALGGGPINPAPFVLIGPPSAWVGLKE